MKNLLVLCIFVALGILEGCDSFAPRQETDSFKYFNDGYYNKCRSHCKRNIYYDNEAHDQGFFGNRYTDRRFYW